MRVTKPQDSNSAQKTYLNKNLLKSFKLSFHHQFLPPTIWRRWVRMNDLHCPQSFVKSIAPLSVSPSDAMSSFISSIQCSPGLTLFLFPSNEKGKHNLTLTDPHDDQLETNYRFSFRTGLLINMGGLISGEIVLAKCPGSVVSAISREMFERTAWIPSWNGTS